MIQGCDRCGQNTAIGLQLSKCWRGALIFPLLLLPLIPYPGAITHVLEANVGFRESLFSLLVHYLHDLPTMATNHCQV